MKISDFIFQYSSYNKNDGLCRVRTFYPTENRVYALLTDIGDLNPSSSVANTVETIITELIGKGFVPHNTKFIEHHEKYSFYLVSLKDSHTPVWCELSKMKVLELLECEEKELTSSIKNNP